jgi:ABC-2 type transport system ATP-binding protein
MNTPMSAPTVVVDDLVQDHRQGPRRRRPEPAGPDRDHRPARPERRRQDQPAARAGHGARAAGGARPAARPGPLDAEQRRDIRRRLGYLPQEPGYSRTFTAFELVDYVAVLKEMTDRRARHEEVRRVLELVDLADLSSRKVQGPVGRHAPPARPAQALLGDPELVVLDEPTVGLDPEQRLRFRDLVSRTGEDRTVVLSTHQVEDVAALCEHVVVVDRGRTLFAGSVPELVATAEGASGATSAATRALLAWRLGTGEFHHIGSGARRRDAVPPEPRGRLPAAARRPREDGGAGMTAVSLLDGRARSSPLPVPVVLGCRRGGARGVTRSRSPGSPLT